MIGIDKKLAKQTVYVGLFLGIWGFVLGMHIGYNMGVDDEECFKLGLIEKFLEISSIATEE